MKTHWLAVIWNGCAIGAIYSSATHLGPDLMPLVGLIALVGVLGAYTIGLRGAR